MVGKKRKAAAAAAAAISAKAAKENSQSAPTTKAERRAKRAQERRANRAQERHAEKERRAAKLKYRRRDGALWAKPAPPGLVGRLEKPKVKDKYHSYFEFADNAEKKKKLEFQVTDKLDPPPGFKFVPMGDPTLSKACKELSREQDAMIFIVSSSKERENKISNHVYRIGYHFRESIVDTARETVGETELSRRVFTPNQLDPIPNSQAEINKQASDTMLDLFPRIPNTDREMILAHAFQKGAQFGGKPVVGLAPDIPLSRRVQLAVLAHIRHTHTRYDLLLRETEWMNARKVVEPVCLDVLVKWRGDEETGRDQLEEILREVVVITDSEDNDSFVEDEAEDNSEEGETDSESSDVPRPSISLPSFRRRREPQSQPSLPTRNKVAQRGLQRYRAAWQEAQLRQKDNPRIPEAPEEASRLGRPPLAHSPNEAVRAMLKPRQWGLPHRATPDQRFYETFINPERPDHPRPPPAKTYQREVRQLEYSPARHGTSPYTAREQPPPVVVRASPNHGLNDMLVPSIEPASSDAAHYSPGLNSHHNYLGRQGTYARRDVNRSVQSPQRRVIVIEDDTPPGKRRRVVYDDAGHFRPAPNLDADLHFRAQRSGSYSLPASSVQPRDFIRHDLPSHSAHGSLSDAQPSTTVRPEDGHSPLPYDRYRRTDVARGSVLREGPLLEKPVDSNQEHIDRSSTRQLFFGDMKMYERLGAHQPHTSFSSRETVQRPLPSTFSVQTRLEQPLPGARDDFITLSESSYRSPVPQNNISRRYEDRPAEIFTTIRSSRPPAQYIERRIQDEREQTFYSSGQAVTQRYHIVERIPQFEKRQPVGDSPVYVRTVRRPVVVLD